MATVLGVIGCGTLLYFLLLGLNSHFNKKKDGDKVSS